PGVDVRESTVTNVPLVAAANANNLTSRDLQGNSNWFFGTNTVTGTLTNANLAVPAATVKLVNTKTTTIATQTTDTNGIYTFPFSDVVEGDKILVYVDGNVLVDAVTATRAHFVSGNFTNLNLLSGRLIVRDDAR